MLADRCLAVLAVLAAASASSHATPAIEPSQPFSVQDLVRLERISEPAASHDGKRLAYTLGSTDLQANQSRTSIWLLETHRRSRAPATAPTRLSDLAADAHSAEWSADGGFVYFLSNKSGADQVWRVARGAEPLQITHLPLAVGSFHVSPKADRLLVTLEVYRDCADFECTRQRLETNAHDAAHGILYDALFVRHWGTWNDGRRSQLFSLALDDTGLATGTPRNLTEGIDGDVPGKPWGGGEAYAFSPDGRQVAFSVRAVPLGEPWSTNFDIYLVAASGGLAQNLTAENPAWDATPAFSPDGSQLAYVAMDRPGFEADKFHLVLLDLRSGRKRPLTQNWDRSIASFAWGADGTTLFATTDHLGQHPLWAIDASTGRAAAISAAGAVEGFSVSAQKVFYTQSNLAHPADLYSVGFAGGKTQQFTHLNQALLAQRKMGDYEQFNFPGWHAENVFGYVVKPADFKRDRKYPVALLVHGGPHASLANAWHRGWNVQNFAGAGYGVVMIDFHGSSGYGQAFSDSISGDWGGKPLEDLQLGLAAALKQFPWLDGDHMCALGGDYGGYMVNWIAGQWPDRFRCLVSHDGIFDNRSLYYSTEQLSFPEWENGGPEYLNPAGYAKHNPIDYVTRWKTPTLVIQGQLDNRVPYEQGLAVFTALQRSAVPSELLYFAEEDHRVSKPTNSIQWYDTALAWMNRWTRP